MILRKLILVLILGHSSTPTVQHVMRHLQVLIDRVELFVEHEDGWNEYAGRIEYRSDGFIEIYDSNWTMVARTVDLSNPDNLLKWSDLTDETSTKYVEGLETSWDEVENYLPSALRDDSTTDADEREDLVFTQNQWGDLNVFSATGDLLARIDSWEHDRILGI